MSQTGTIVEIHITPSKRQKIQQVENAELEAGKGIVGDRYHALSEAHLEKGLPVHENHLSLISKEELDAFLERNNSDLQYGDFRRSVITQDVDLNSLVGKKFRLGSAVCFGVEPCEPCSYLSKSVHSAVLPELVNRGGLRATILESGAITPGDEIAAVGE